MSQDNLDRKELLEQYLLGLTSREQTEYIEEQLEKDPEMAAELETLQGRMTDYIAEQGLEYDASGRQRSLQDFHDLDHEMITAMTRRNHSLVIWRLALSAACLALLFISGYLFRSNQNYRLEVSREKALHAQDEASAQKKIDNLRERTTLWDSLHTQTIPSPAGNVFVHFIPNDSVTFLDLSHLEEPTVDEAYHLELTQLNGAAERLAVADSSWLALMPIGTGVQRIAVWKGGAEKLLPRDTAALAPVASFPVAPGQGALTVK